MWLVAAYWMAQVRPTFGESKTVTFQTLTIADNSYLKLGFRRMSLSADASPHISPPPVLVLIPSHNFEAESMPVGRGAAGLADGVGVLSAGWATP